MKNRGKSRWTKKICGSKKNTTNCTPYQKNMEQQIAQFCKTTNDEQNCLASAEGLMQQCGICLQDPSNTKCIKKFEAPVGMGDYFSGATGTQTCLSLFATMPQNVQNQVQTSTSLAGKNTTYSAIHRKNDIFPWPW